jgi:UDP-hydrolysing UDP-N-acetyl-D-glucosamine 2-epimerase
MTKSKKKICVVVNSRANYGRIRSFLYAVQNHHQLDLQLVVGASALLPKYGSVIDIIERDGFQANAKLYTILEGETPLTMAKSTGLAILEISTAFDNLKPDIVLTVADRFETLATAVAASYMNIPLAHSQGGESTGSIDESVRHAITKLAHLHFPATKVAAETIVRMGENPSNVFCVGCPSIDLLVEHSWQLPPNIFFDSGVGATIDVNKPYIVVLQHPVTTEYESALFQINQTLAAVHRSDCQVIWLWPNVDAGSDEISKGLRSFREKNLKTKIRFFRNFGPIDYAKVIKASECLVGNSSSGIREGAYLGVPTVNIGSRQRNRELGANVICTDYAETEIYSAIFTQLEHGPYEKCDLYGDGTAGEKMADIIASHEVSIHKRLCY